MGIYVPEKIVIENSSLLYSHLAEEWLAYAATYAHKSTHSMYKYTVSHYILPVLGNLQVTKLDEVKIYSFLNHLKTKGVYPRYTPLADSTVKNILCILKISLTFAERRYGITNMAKYLRPLKAMRREQIMTDQDWQTLHRVLENDSSETGAAIALAAYLGMRLGEICALKRKDINPEQRTIYICRTAQRLRLENNKNGSKTVLQVGTPKSDTSKRLLPIPDMLWPHLRRLMLHRRNEDFLFSGNSFKALDPRTLQYRFHSYLKKCGLPPMNFHRLRHKFAGSCVERKVDIKCLSEILGHSTVSTTLNYYVHPSQDFKRQQLNNLYAS